jgi:hypothetical protein
LIATVASNARSAHAERPPALVPTTQPAPTQPAPTQPAPMQLEPVRIGPALPAPTFERVPLTDAQRGEWIERTRVRRLALGSLASLGVTALMGGVAASSVALGVIACTGFCTSSIVTAIVLPSGIGVAAVFVLPAVFLAGAQRYGVRGSYWATFGGLWLGLATGSGMVAGALAARANTAAMSVVTSVAAILPFAGMSLAFELTARVDDERPLREHRAARSATRSGLPLLSIERDRVSVGWSGWF